MKRTLAVLTVLGALIMGSTWWVAAASGSSVDICIPFAFHAGNQRMPAGDYRFEMPVVGAMATGSMLRIVSLDASHCQHLISRTILPVTTDTDWHVSFSKIGDQYFLSKVWNGDYGAELSKTPTARSLEYEYEKRNAVVTIELRMSLSKVK
jgi:hypothetical protein